MLHYTAWYHNSGKRIYGKTFRLSSCVSCLCSYFSLWHYLGAVEASSKTQLLKAHDEIADLKEKLVLARSRDRSEDVATVQHRDVYVQTLGNVDIDAAGTVGLCFTMQ